MAGAILGLLIPLYRSRGVFGLDLEDLAQDCIERLYQRELHALRTYDPSKGPFPTWLRTVAINLHREKLASAAERKKQAEISLEAAGEPAGSGCPDERRMEDAIFTAIRELRPKEDRVCMLFHVVGLKDREISEILGMALGTVATRIRRARNKLCDAGFGSQEYRTDSDHAAP